MEQPTYGWFVGLDWGGERHCVCVLDEKRVVVADRFVEHGGEGLAELADLLTQLSSGDVARVAVGIEVPRGPVVETLVERGVHVYAINPKQLDRFRDRFTVAGAKDDRRDAHVLADSLATDRAAYRRIKVDDPLVLQLRSLSRLDEELGQELGRLNNRLRDQLHRYFPSLLKLSPAADDPWLWALLELAPTPKAAAGLRHVVIKRLLRQYRIRRLEVDDVLAVLKSPPLRLAEGTVEAAVEYVASLVPRLRLIHEQRRRCGKRIDDVLATLAADVVVEELAVKARNATTAIGDTTAEELKARDATAVDVVEACDATTAVRDTAAEKPSNKKREHRDAAILQSLPGVGRVVAATMLAEASQPLAERDYHVLRAQAGVAPITRQSGKRKAVSMRRGCNYRLRNAVYYWSNTSIQHDPASRAHYDQLRHNGQSHGRALRSVADSLLRRLFAMLRHGTLYDATRPRRLHQLPLRQPVPVAVIA